MVNNSGASQVNFASQKQNWALQVLLYPCFQHSEGHSNPEVFLFLIWRAARPRREDEDKNQTWLSEPIKKLTITLGMSSLQGGGEGKNREENFMSGIPKTGVLSTFWLLVSGARLQKGRAALQGGISVCVLKAGAKKHLRSFREVKFETWKVSDAFETWSRASCGCGWKSGDKENGE